MLKKQFDVSRYRGERGTQLMADIHNQVIFHLGQLPLFFHLPDFQASRLLELGKFALFGLIQLAAVGPQHTPAETKQHQAKGKHNRRDRKVPMLGLLELSQTLAGLLAMFVDKGTDLLLHLLHKRIESWSVNSQYPRCIACVHSREQLSCSQQVVLLFREHLCHEFLVRFWVSDLVGGCRLEILGQQSSCHLKLASSNEVGLKAVLVLERFLS